ncbi:hypothetical protein MLD38_001685 [Melastoma candidum]|uniref:Uncharacterized protein n=1 Tax=Melastoma candidum TaxID=119954 RepID=A0ACB9SE53_9MYRT|nr:hypothetical protein MLD38_001685 [Melastoma candidum]
MDLHPFIDHRIRETIETALGLPSHPCTLDSNLLDYEEALSRLRGECSLLRLRLDEKDQLISRAKAEAAMNAQAVRKFVEANRSLAGECAELLVQRNKLETECSLYDHDREALMDFGNEAEERARDAEARVQQLEGEVQRLSDELRLQNHDLENQMDGELAKARMQEDELLESVVSSVIDKGEAELARAFLEAHSSQESCKELLQMWDMLRPSTQKVLSLAAMVRKLEKDKELCRINLRKAEDEVKLFYEENSILQEENKRLLLHYQRERSLSCSRSTSKSGTSAKTNKRKTSSRANTTPVKRIDFSEAESPRHPLSSLKQNSPDIIRVLSM